MQIKGGKRLRRRALFVQKLYQFGGEVLAFPRMQQEKQYVQHGKISCFSHSVAVAYVSVWIALRLHIRVDMKSLVRGALLHDYFLYDWHDPDPSHRLHGFRHAWRALENASRDFALTSIERDIIAKHMFPLNPRPPRYRETVIVTCADKFCAVCEMVSFVSWILRLSAENSTEDDYLNS